MKTVTVAIPKGFYQVEAEGVCVRFGALPTGASTNWTTGENEAGVSVYPAWKDPATGFCVLYPQGLDENEWGEDITTQDDLVFSDLPIYEVAGELLEEKGSDGEPLLAVGTARILREISRDEISLLWDKPQSEALSGKPFPPGRGPRFDRVDIPLPEGLPSLEVVETADGWQVLVDGMPQMIPWHTRAAADEAARDIAQHEMWRLRRGESQGSVQGF